MTWIPGSSHKPAWMDRRPLAWLVLAIVASCLLDGDAVDGGTQWVAGSPVTHVPTTAQQAAYEECAGNAVLSHDVQWAEACARLEATGQTDGHADCELPDAEAQRLVGLLQRGERSCRTEATARAR